MTHSSALLKIALAKTRGMTPDILRAMQECAVSVTDFFNLDTQELGARLGLREKHYILRSDRDKALEKAVKEEEFIHRNGIRALLLGNEGYPARLAETPDAPLMLFVLGEADLDHCRSLGIVGTRRCTPYGTTLCSRIVSELTESVGETLIVSGLASGTDSCAHSSALESGSPTVAVLAHGLDMIYPAGNRHLAASIIKAGGALVTEYGIGAHPYKRSFLERNRIIAGLSDMTLVVESGIKGGAMSTARCAFEYSREVGAIPGRATDEMSSGCNLLIRKQQASLIESAADISTILGWKRHNSTTDALQKELFEIPEGEAGTICQIIRMAGSPLTMDEIIARSGISASRITGMLTDLEFDGIIIRYPGNRFDMAF